MFVDTHTHLYLPEFDNDGTSAVARAIDAGVRLMIFPNVDVSTVAPLLNLHGRYPDNTYCAMGLHPTEVNNSWTEAMDNIPINNPEVIAIGEIGIDLYWSDEFKRQQQEAFIYQCNIALQMNLPIIIHQRNALKEVLDVFKSLPHPPKGVFHSFGGSIEDVRKIRETGDFYFGINGIVTFKNSKLREVLPEIGIDRILLETDSPYLAPVPHRGKRNESAYIPHIAAYIANALNIGIDIVERQTTANARNLFNL